MVKPGADLARAGRAWQRFLCEAVDPAPLGVLRWAFGLYLAAYYLELSPFLDLFHVPPALVTPDRLADAPFWNVLRYLRPDATSRWLVFGLTVLAALTLAAGFQTRLSAALCWLLNQAWMFGLGGRNSGDNVVSLVCFLWILAALPGYAASAFSLDARLDPSARRERIPAWPLRLFQVQLALIYFFSGFHKLSSRDWYLGQAMFYVWQHTTWSRFDLSGLTHPLVVGVASYAALAVELFVFPFLVWIRSLRPYALAAGLALHLGIGLTMRIFVFGEIMPLLYLAFLDPRPLLQAVARRLPERVRARLGAAEPAAEPRQS